MTEYYSSLISADISSSSNSYLKTKMPIKLIPMPVLPDVKERNDIVFDCFLYEFLFHVGDDIWNFPQILSFFDDTMDQPSIKDAHLLFLSQKVSVTIASCQHFFLFLFSVFFVSFVFFCFLYLSLFFSSLLFPSILFFCQESIDIFIAFMFMILTALFYLITIDTIVLELTYLLLLLPR